jgi:hypothetical protein
LFSVSEVVKGQTIVRHLIDAESFRHQLMTFGDKLTQEEIDDIFGEFEFDDDGFILTKSVVSVHPSHTQCEITQRMPLK